MMQKDEKNCHCPETSKSELKEGSSLTADSIAGLTELEKIDAPSQVASYEYNGTTYYQHEGTDAPTTFRHKPRAGINNDSGKKLFFEGGVAYRSHRTPANVRGRGDSCSGRGAPRNSRLSSFGEAELTRNFKIQDSLAMRRESKFASSWSSAKFQVYNTPLYTKSGQPYVPISVANTSWYRTRRTSVGNDEPETMAIGHRDKGVLSQGSPPDSFIEKSNGKSKEQSKELENGESNETIMKRTLNEDNESFEVEAIKDMSVKDLKCLKPTAAPAKALVRIFEPMLKNWKEVISAASDASGKNVNEDGKQNTDKSETSFVVEPECKENGKSMPILYGNEAQHIILEEMSQKLLGSSEPVSHQIPLPQKRQDELPDTRAKNPGMKEELQFKEISSREDVAYSNSYSPATGLRMIEATSSVRKYVFTIGDRREIAHVITPLVKELVVMDKFGGKLSKCRLQIGVMVESQEQFFCAIEAANRSFKSRGFQFEALANNGNGNDVLGFLKMDKKIPKVDCNGMYQITVKFDLPKGNEKKVDKSLGHELEKEVRDCRVEKISSGPGERILLMGNVRDMLKASKNVKKVFNIIPSKHNWNNELARERKRSKDKETKKRYKLRKKEREAKNKEQSEITDSSIAKPNAVQASPILDLNLHRIHQAKEESAPLLSNQSATLTLIDSVSACVTSEMQLKSSEGTGVIISHDHKKSAMRSPSPEDRDDDCSGVKTSPLTKFIRLMEGGDKNSNLKLLQDSFVKCPNDDEENEGQVFEMLEKAMAAGNDVGGEMQMKVMAFGKDDKSKKLENGMVARNDDNDQMLEKFIYAGDNQMIKFIENEVCQLGEENELIFQSIDKSKIDIVKEDTNWYGNISDFKTNKNNCSLWNVHVTFEAKEATEIAYFGLREKYNGVNGGC